MPLRTVGCLQLWQRYSRLIKDAKIVARVSKNTVLVILETFATAYRIILAQYKKKIKINFLP